jgi:hypothetical protein
MLGKLCIVLGCDVHSKVSNYIFLPNLKKFTLAPSLRKKCMRHLFIPVCVEKK